MLWGIDRANGAAAGTRRGARTDSSGMCEPIIQKTRWNACNPVFSTYCSPKNQAASVEPARPAMARGKLLFVLAGSFDDGIFRNDVEGQFHGDIRVQFDLHRVLPQRLHRSE